MYLDWSASKVVVLVRVISQTENTTRPLLAQTITVRVGVTSYELGCVSGTAQHGHTAL